MSTISSNCFFLICFWTLFSTIFGYPTVLSSNIMSFRMSQGFHLTNPRLFFSMKIRFEILNIYHLATSIKSVLYYNFFYFSVYGSNRPRICCRLFGMCFRSDPRKTHQRFCHRACYEFRCLYNCLSFLIHSLQVIGFKP